MYARSPEVSYQLPKHIYIQSSYRITPKKLQHTHTHTIVRMLSHGALMTFYAIFQANYALETTNTENPHQFANQTKPKSTKQNQKHKLLVYRLPRHIGTYFCVIN